MDIDKIIQTFELNNDAAAKANTAKETKRTEDDPSRMDAHEKWSLETLLPALDEAKARIIKHGYPADIVKRTGRENYKSHPLADRVAEVELRVENRKGSNVAGGTYIRFTWNPMGPLITVTQQTRASVGYGSQQVAIDDRSGQDRRKIETYVEAFLKALFSSKATS